MLENAYNTTIDAMDLEFLIRIDTNGKTKDGFVEYILNGDMNDDGFVNDLDVNPFVQALTNRADYETAYPDVDADMVGDFNGNGVLDLGDVNGFKAAVPGVGAGSAGTVPEPSVMTLVLSAIVGLLFGRRRHGSSPRT